MIRVPGLVIILIPFLSTRPIQSLYPDLFRRHADYIFRILHLADFDASGGADAQLFSIAAKLCGKIEASGNWMQQMIMRQDQAVLDAKWPQV